MINRRRSALREFIAIAAVALVGGVGAISLMWSRSPDPPSADLKGQANRAPTPPIMILPTSPAADDPIEMERLAKLREQARERIAREEAPSLFSIKDFGWSKSYSVMTARFTFENKSDFDIKDILVKCEHMAPSGTTIDSNSRQIFEVFNARSTRTIKNFNMGFIHSQAASSYCTVVDMTVADYHRPPAPPRAAAAGSAKQAPAQSR